MSSGTWAPADTIVAPCTAAGAGSRAIVRLSGAQAHEMAAAVVTLSRDPEPGCVVPAVLELAQGAPLPVEVLSWWAPRSLTGEDVLEVHLPGWPAVVTELVRRLVARGARPATRGEFARRALALGKIDLPGVLALGRLVSASTADEAAAAADDLLDGATAERKDLRAALLDALALIEAHVDFEEEDTEEVGEADLVAALERVAVRATRMGQRGAHAATRDGETDVVLLGAPNVGKSLLFTALCPDACTTVSPVAGTTRDMLEARLTRDGRQFRVLDGPGIDWRGTWRGTWGGTGDGTSHGTGASVDRLAMERFVATIPEAAVVLLVDDASCPTERATRLALEQAAGARRRVEVLNKIDLVESSPGSSTGPSTGPGSAQPVRVSALLPSGLDDLWRAIVTASPEPGAPDLASRADAEAAAAILPLLEEAAAQPLEGSLPTLSWALRDVLEVLEREQDRLLDVDEEILDRIFAEFCVGK